jgi:hypothetical protein
MTFPSYFLGYLPCQNRQNVQMGSENEARKNGRLTRENDEESMDINGFRGTPKLSDPNFGATPHTQVPDLHSAAKASLKPLGPARGSQLEPWAQWPPWAVAAIPFPLITYLSKGKC